MPQNLVAFSHLRWDFVYQRPQHLLARLAKQYAVHFVEEPVRTQAEPHFEVSEPAAGIHVYRPHTALPAVGFHDDQIPLLQRLLNNLVADRGLADCILWFYSPMALPLARAFAPQAIVYDCMDELSGFLKAPKQLQQRENALLKVADLVFTGGQSLYRAKRPRHPSVHCFPSSVDRAHFGRAAQPGNEHPDQVAIPHPRLGFFGVIDERIDLELIASLAEAHPEWHICMVGPVVKIPRSSLPRHRNIHYFGQRSYSELPEFLAGWDVCLMPFALNDATRFISPTKTLEYMAAERPIVSTGITDVVEPYGDIVHVAERATFGAQCERVLALRGEDWERRRTAMRATVARTSWDTTVDAMNSLLEGTIRRKRRQPAARPHVPSPSPNPAAPARVETYETIVIGAGPTGLSAAYHLGKGSLLLERDATVGGWCRSFTDGGYTFDCAGHIMFSKDEYVLELYKKLLGDNVHWQNREAWIFSQGVHTRYPFQGALYGLPPDVLKECLVGAIEARFGSISGGTSIEPGQPCTKDATITDCCADGVVDDPASLLSAAPRPPAQTEEPRNFEEFIYKIWGTGVAKHFAIPYNRKLWAVPLSEMETSWLGGRVPLPNLAEMIEGALRPVPKPVGPNARFGYPLRGGFQALMNGFLPLLKGDLRLQTSVTRVDAKKREVTVSDGTRVKYDTLISTAPLPALIELLGVDVPEPIRTACAQLRHVSVRCVNLGVGRANLTEKHWVYYPDDTVFHRIFMQGNASPHCNAPGGFGLTCEITYSPTKPLPCDGEELIQLCIDDCIRVGLFTAADRVEVRNQLDMPFAYVVYDHARKRSVDTIRQWLRGHDVILAGRYSEWEYYNSDHAFIAGKIAAHAAAARTRRLGASSDAM